MPDKKHLIGYGAILAVLIFIGYQYIESQKSLQEMETTIQLKEKENDALKEKDKQREKDLQDLKEQTESRLSAIERQRASIRTPEQAIRVVHDSVPQISQSSTVASAPDVATVLSQSDAKRLADFALQFKALEIKVEALEKTVALKDEKIVSLETQNKNLVIERDAAVKAAKKGFWRRAFSGAKWFGAGVVVGIGIKKFAGG